MDHNKNKKLNIAIVGGGIVGISTGLTLLEQIPNDRFENITILSDKWTPNTTGDISAGLIYPYLTGEDNPKEFMERICYESMKFYNRLIHQSDSGKLGMSMITMFQLYEKNEDIEKPLALETFPFFRDLSQNEIEQMFPNSNYHYGYILGTYIAEPTLLLPNLMEKFEKQKGKLETIKVDSLDSLNEKYDLIINCTGIDSKYLCDVNDDQLKPVRGQVIRVEAPWIKHAILADKWYIIPQSKSIVLGGTRDKDNYNLIPNPKISEQILLECCKLMPSLKFSKKLGDFVGLRPYRNRIRLEIDQKNPKLIHNYGHGGSGVTLCWGTALEVAKIVKDKFL